MADGLEIEGTARYEIRRRLGAGGMGIVYEALDRERGSLVALKTLPTVDAAGIYRLKREFRSLADVSHPNLVVLHELVSAAGQWFFTMDLVEGVDFLRWVRRGVDPKSAATVEVTPTDPSGGRQGTRASPVGTEVDERRLRDALGQLARALGALHGAGKLHRDVKPSNILVNREGHVTVLDFGLASEVGPAADPYRSLDERVMGTPAYMAPEQAAGRAATAASDWYAVGAMLYEALTGVLPFAGSVVHVLAMKQLRDPAPVDHVARGAPRDLAELAMDLLRRDPDERPTGDEVLARLAGSPAAPRRPRSPTPADAPPLRGRDAQLAVLADAFGAARGGTPVIVRVEGPSGYGKTALVQCFLDHLRAEGSAVVLAGRCYERETVPFKALDAAVDALSRYLRRLPAEDAAALLPRDVHALARVFPVLCRVRAIEAAPERLTAAGDAQELRRRAFHALKELLGRIADRRPLVVFVDDLQWGDADSATLVAELLRPPDAPSLLCIAAWRSGDADQSPLVRSLRAEGLPVELREIALGPLSVDDARTVARDLLSRGGAGDVDALAEQVAREAEGSPFFVGELVRHALARPAAEELHLAGVLRLRLEQLSDGARRLLEIVAVAGGPIETTVAVNAAKLGRDAPGALVALRVGSLVRSHAARREEVLETYHDRVREAVVGGLDPQALRRAHRRLARAMMVRGDPDPEALAEHLEGAGEREEAGSFAREAAARATHALAFDRAVRLYRRALSLRPDDAPERWEIEEALGDALAHDGRSAEAAEAYLRAAAGAGGGALDLRRRAAEHLLRSGHVDRGLEVLGDVLAGVGMRLAPTPNRALLSLLARRARLRLRGLSFEERAEDQVEAADLRRVDACWAVAIGLSMVDPIRGAEFQARHLERALEAGEPYRVARALAVDAAHTASLGRRGAARAGPVIDRAEAIARRIDHPHAVGLVEGMRATCAFFAGRWKEAFERSERADAVLRERCTNVAWELATNTRFNFVALYYMGRLRELARRVPERFETARERDDLYARACAGSGCAVTAWLAVDDVRAAESNLEMLGEQWSERGFQLQHYLLLQGWTHTDLYVGRGERAWARIEEEWPALERSLLLRVQMLRVIMHAERASCALAAGGESRLRAAAADARALSKEGLPWSDAMASLIRAGVAKGRGDTERAAALLAEAAESLEALDAALFAAAARRHRGVLVGGEEGRALVERADARFGAEGVREPEAAAHMLSPGFR